MIKVRLYTRDNAYVTTVELLPFIGEMPDVILWGERVFVKNAKGQYIEGFCAIAMNPEFEDVDAQLKKTYTADAVEEILPGKPIGNDEFLIGLPKDVDEAIDTFIDFYHKAQDFELIKGDEEEFITGAHLGAGMFLRNSWFLWWHEGHNYAKWPLSKPPLVKFFNDLNIWHPDDISSIIIRSAYRKINNLPIDLEAQCAHYIQYWKDQGYADGKPR